MDKIRISDFHIKELPYFKENDPNANPYQDFYKDVDLLQLVNKMSHIILKKPEKRNRFVKKSFVSPASFVCLFFPMECIHITCVSKLCST